MFELLEELELLLLTLVSIGTVAFHIRLEQPQVTRQLQRQIFPFGCLPHAILRYYTECDVLVKLLVVCLIVLQRLGSHAPQAQQALISKALQIS